MNRRIAVSSARINTAAVLSFALCMLFGFDEGSYFSSMFIALSFIPMVGGYAYFSDEKTTLAGNAAFAFAGIYTTVILLVYFAQLTTVRLTDLSPEVRSLLDFRQFGLMFNFDLLGYAVMALSTFFAGLTIAGETKADCWLRWLLLIHGLFFISCITAPMLGLFKPNGPKWIGTAVLEFWCAYFCPIGILSSVYFARRDDHWGHGSCRGKDI